MVHDRQKYSFPNATWQALYHEVPDFISLIGVCARLSDSWTPLLESVSWTWTQQLHVPWLLCYPRTKVAALIASLCTYRFFRLLADVHAGYLTVCAFGPCKQAQPSLHASSAFIGPDTRHHRKFELQQLQQACARLPSSHKL